MANCKGDCVGDCVTHADNTDKMNMSCRTSCNLGAEKKLLLERASKNDTGDVKNDSQSFRCSLKG